ncbi:MAG: AAA family ATPase [Gemmataceae bacterium]
MGDLTELLVAIFSTAGALITVFGAVLGYLISVIRELKRELKSQREQHEVQDQRIIEIRQELKRWHKGFVEERRRANKNATLANRRQAKIQELKLTLEDDKHKNVQKFEEQTMRLERYWSSLLNQKINDLERQHEGELERSKTVHAAEISKLQADIQAKAKLIASSQVEITSLQETKAQLSGELEKVTEEHLESRDELFQNRATHARISDRTTRVWERPVPENVPTFLSWRMRRATIISVLNLKGGVGKTTLTANLAAAMWENDRSKKVIAVDLDYQRTLTQLCCSHQHLAEKHDRKECIQHFLLTQEPKAPFIPVVTPSSNNKECYQESYISRKFKQCLTPVRRHNGIEEMFQLVTCSEVLAEQDASGTLDDTEMQLFGEWLIEKYSLDTRFLLRRALHTDPIRNQFDYILLDCPPRLSLSCINALAASDYVLIPVLLDETSSPSVPLLLKKLKRLSKIPHLVDRLQVLGVVANEVRYSSGELIDPMKKVWTRMTPTCERAWEGTVHQFESKIQDSAYFSAAAAALGPDFAVLRHEFVRSMFKDLLEEIEGRIQYERENTSALSTNTPYSY